MFDGSIMFDGMMDDLPEDKPTDVPESTKWLCNSRRSSDDSRSCFKPAVTCIRGLNFCALHGKGALLREIARITPAASPVAPSESTERFDPENVMRWDEVTRRDASDPIMTWTQVVRASDYDELLTLYRDKLASPVAGGGELEKQAPCGLCGKPMKRSGAGMHVHFADDRRCENRCLPELLRVQPEGWVKVTPETIYVIVRSGDWTQDMNGTPVTAPLVRLYGAWSTREAAECFLPTIPDEPGWGISAAWIEEILLCPAPPAAEEERSSL